VAAGVALVAAAVLFGRYLQVELADEHSSPFTGEHEFDVRQLIDGPPDAD
jgi:hypothetical protein